MTAAAVRGRIAPALRHAQAFALFVCVFSLPVQALALVPGTALTLTKVAGGALVCLVVAERLLLLRSPLPRIGIESAALFALGAGAMSLTASVARDESLRALLVYTQYVLICYACAHVAMRHSTQANIVWLIACGGALSGAGAIAARMGWGTISTVDTLVPGSSIRRVCFGVSDANEQAMLLVFALALLVFVPRSHSARMRTAAFWLLFLLLCGGLVLTMSRTGWVCAAIVLALRAMTYRRRAIVIVPAAALAVLVGIVALSVFRPGIMETVKRRVTETTSAGDRSVASRIVYNTKAISSARQGGPFGFGLDSVYRVTQDFTDPLGRRVGVTVHNVPLTVWIETGWVGLIAFLWLWSCIVTTLVSAWRRAKGPDERQRLGGYCAVALSYAVFSQTMPFLQRSSLPILLGCALGAAALHPLASEDGHSTPPHRD